MACYSAADFPRAQTQLVTQGLDEDGYEAIHFALNNVPFRNSPFIAKNILLITDEGRTIIPEGVNITRQSIEQELKVLYFAREPENLCILLELQISHCILREYTKLFCLSYDYTKDTDFQLLVRSLIKDCMV